jgi:hypothetical protein
MGRTESTGAVRCWFLAPLPRSRRPGGIDSGGRRPSPSARPLFLAGASAAHAHMASRFGAARRGRSFGARVETSGLGAMRCLRYPTARGHAIDLHMQLPCGTGERMTFLARQGRTRLKGLGFAPLRGSPPDIRCSASPSEGSAQKGAAERKSLWTAVRFLCPGGSLPPLPSRVLEDASAAAVAALCSRWSAERGRERDLSSERTPRVRWAVSPRSRNSPTWRRTPAPDELPLPWPKGGEALRREEQRCPSTPTTGSRRAGERPTRFAESCAPVTRAGQGVGSATSRGLAAPPAEPARSPDPKVARALPPLFGDEPAP